MAANLSGFRDAPPDPNAILISRSQEWQGHHAEQISPIHRINGFPWYLRLHKDKSGKLLSVVCDKSSESELWQCNATITYNAKSHTHAFISWDKASQEFILYDNVFYGLSVKIETDDDGESWRRFTSLDPIEPRDGILVIGPDDKKVYVNKQALSSQSPFFEKLFNCDFKEKNMAEIPIGDVEYEEFCNIIRMVHGFGGSELNGVNVHRVLQLADRFELKIVEDRVVNYLLSSSFTSSISTLQALLLSEQYNIHFLKDKLLSRNYTNAEYKSFSKSSEFKQLSLETVRALYKKSSNQLP